MNLVSLIITLYHGLFLLTPFIFTWTNSELFQISKMLFVYGFAIAIGTLWIMRMIIEKRFIWRKHPAVLLILIFLAGQAVATLFSIHLRTSLLGYYSRLNGGFLSSLAYAVLFLGLLNNVPKKQILPLLLTNIVAASLVALYALPEHFGVSPSCYLMYQEVGVNCWKQDVQTRVFGTFGQPNWLAAYLVGLAPIVALFGFKKINKLQKLWWSLLGLILLVLLFTGSRSGLLGLTLAGMGFGLLHHQVMIKRKWKKFIRPLKNKLFMVGLTAVILLLGFNLVQTQLPSPEDTFNLSQGTSSGDIRLIVWQGALKIWQRYPLFGSGPGTFAYSYYQDRPVTHNLVSEWDNLYNKAHNEILNYLAETGLVGALTYLLLIGGLMWLLFNSTRTQPKKVSVEHAILLSMIGLTTAHFFGFSTVMSNLLLFLLPAIAFLPEEIIIKKTTAMVGWQKWMMGALTLIALILFWQISQVWIADWYFAKAQKLKDNFEYSQAATDLQKATEIMPREALYYDELANLYSETALQYFLLEEPEASLSLAGAAVQNSDYALLLNPRNLNFYKTRARVFFLLAQTDTKYFSQAEQTLQAAIALSPTDAQLWYNLGIAQQSQGKFAQAVETLQHTVDIRFNYVKARIALGDLLVQLGRVEEGKKQYRFILENLASTDLETKEKLEALEQPTNETP
ncbi:MAG: O-antigen ligase family protein [Candidatus Paceibacterota bacterium]